MVRLFSKGALTLSGRWKLLVGSVLAAALIGLSCGLCESSTKQVCQSMFMAIASSLSPTDQLKNVTSNNSKIGTTSLTTILLTTTTSETSSNAYAATFLKRYATIIAASMATKTSDLTIMPVSSTAHLTISSSINKSKALLPMRAKLYSLYGLMDSAQLANSISKRHFIRPLIYNKKLQAFVLTTPICATTNMALRSGLNPHTQRCRLNRE